jgi:Kelch motif protein
LRSGRSGGCQSKASRSRRDLRVHRANPVRSRLQALAVRGLTRFVGRDAQLESLLRALETARARHDGSVRVTASIDVRDHRGAGGVTGEMGCCIHRRERRCDRDGGLMRRAVVFLAVFTALGFGAGPSDPSAYPATAAAAAQADVGAMGRWERGAAALSDRSEVAGAVLGGRIDVVGGLTAIGVTSDVQEYDPAADRWTARAPLPQAIHHPAAAAIGGRLYVMGGFVVQGWSIWHAVNTIYEYDSATDHWRSRASMPTARGALTAVAVDGKIYAIGGTADRDTGATEVYDPAADAWKQLRPMPTPRNHLAAVVVDSRIIVFGGRAGAPARNVGAVEAYDPRTDTWQARKPLPTPRSGIGAAVVAGRVYVMGGELGRPGTYPENEEYDPATDRWASRAPMPTPRHGLAVVAVGGRIYALNGGPRPGGTYSNVNEIYVPPR